jgi:ParB-like nuclease domain
MSTARKLKAHDPNFTAARLEPGRKWIAIKNLEAPDELQPRAGIDKGWVSQLAAWFKEGSQFPPARIYQLPDGRLMLSEGHHRRWALLDCGETDMLCEVVDGTMEQAIEHAAGSNKGDGPKPMGPRDVTRAVEMLLGIDMWWNKSETIISKQVGCSPGKVATIRRRISDATGKPVSKLVEYERDDLRGKRYIRRRSSNRRDVAISPCGTVFQGTYKKKKYRAKTVELLRSKLESVFKAEDLQANALSRANLYKRLYRYGFSTIGWVPCHAYPEFYGCYGHGIICVPCLFSDNSELLTEVGNLRCLMLAVGQLVADKPSVPLAIRSVIVCFRDDGPQKAIKELSESGIEFMTPDELIRSLGAGGMTPDEIQASLKEKRDFLLEQDKTG